LRGAETDEARITVADATGIGNYVPNRALAVVEGGQSAALALNAVDRQNARWCAQDDER
jgi:hypothetical protein